MPEGLALALSLAGLAATLAASDAQCGFQTVLGLLWLLDAALQCQPFMYSEAFARQLKANASAVKPALALSIAQAFGVWWVGTWVPVT